MRNKGLAFSLIIGIVLFANPLVYALTSCACMKTVDMEQCCNHEPSAVDCCMDTQLPQLTIETATLVLIKAPALYSHTLSLIRTNTGREASLAKVTHPPPLIEPNLQRLQSWRL